MNPRVSKVTPLEGYKLRIEFSNGEVGEYDCAPLLEFGVFKELKNVQYFKSVKVVGGTVAWPNEQDICPDTLYLDSVKILAV
ncbi:DUF2442 domain-containing protein [Chlorobaculum sp. MV4-Y]|jgi:hypothetical protein|uniref:DUF2442 domain-containing protein n=1 Tax=Chlorobaculum sp. MV4-Y TaxID=2976335 RepID=UPI0021AE62C9|nr:DUF2442 domain-containing protein [Chlorobaculum sp. MV4-Y]UWX58043.1 DUF2442 domain-containing protein [Chlorobaculum sp. MV4-Y]